MLRIAADQDRRLLLIEPEGPLAAADFEALGAAFDALAGGGEGAVNLVIHAPAFPGWADFAGFFAHVGFVRSHEPRVEKVAIVSESRALDLMPRIADRLMGADFRHFPETGLEAALAWVAEPAEASGGVEVIPGLPEEVLGLSAHGVVTARDYARVIAPAIAARVRPGRKLRMLYRLGEGFDAYTPGAVFADARLGFAHWSDFSRVAIVTDLDWIARAVRIFAPLTPAAVQVFPNAEFEAARAWILAPDPE